GFSANLIGRSSAAPWRLAPRRRAGTGARADGRRYERPRVAPTTARPPKQRVDERGGRGPREEHQDAEQQHADQDRREPPFLRLAQELKPVGQYATLTASRFFDQFFSMLRTTTHHSTCSLQLEL